MFSLSTTFTMLIYALRILQACLKYFAKCPCPRCKINKDKILEMGTRNDLYRRNHLRVDNDDLQYRNTLTRRWMFEEGVSLKSVYMKRVLDPLSLTPTRVRPRVHSLGLLLTIPVTERLLGPVPPIWLQLLLALRARSAA